MFTKKCFFLSIFFYLLITSFPFNTGLSQKDEQDAILDEKVKLFLDKHANQWYDMNVPSVDGQLLYDLIIKNGYKNAVEIGTSTGHSAIWIAWALSKTGGRLITIEINESRYKEALLNFEEAGLSEYIDARLADAHILVKELKDSIDFVFCDADKGWYKNYFIALSPKLRVGGCYTAHNVSRHRRRYQGIGEFLDYIERQPNFETTLNSSSHAGMSISYKKSGE